MSYSRTRDPWRVGDSDSDDDKDKRLRSNIPSITRLSTPKIIKPVNPPKIVDWDTSLDVPRTDIQSVRKYSASSGSSSGQNKPSDLFVPVFTPESPPASPPTLNLSNFDPISLIQEDLSSFVHTYIPKDYPLFVQCSLKRDKDGVQGSLFPTFYLQAERPTDRKKCFLLAARKVAKVNRQSEYLITTNIETLSEKSGGHGYVGKLRENNLAGTEYILYDNGLSPNKLSHHKQSLNKDNLRRELVTIVYNANIFGMKGPRQLTATIPEHGHDIRPMKDEPGILEQLKNRRFSNLIQLHNRQPKYNEETKTYVLQFTGNRVAKPSVKNFQMIIKNENEEEEVVMQFGRIDRDTFTCDYRYPLTAVQAFAIALSSFDSRLVRE